MTTLGRGAGAAGGRAETTPTGAAPDGRAPLAGQVAVVTGAGSELGIGFATARLLGRHGAA